MGLKRDPDGASTQGDPLARHRRSRSPSSMVMWDPLRVRISVRMQRASEREMGGVMAVVVEKGEGDAMRVVVETSQTIIRHSDNKNAHPKKR